MKINRRTFVTALAGVGCLPSVALTAPPSKMEVAYSLLSTLLDQQTAVTSVRYTDDSEWASPFGRKEFKRNYNPALIQAEWGENPVMQTYATNFDNFCKFLLDNFEIPPTGDLELANTIKKELWDGQWPFPNTPLDREKFLKVPEDHVVLMFLTSARFGYRHLFVSPHLDTLKQNTRPVFVAWENATPSSLHYIHNTFES